jgi:hydrogenase maturation protease
MKTLILGLGNPILRDDGIGIHVARALRRLLTNREDVAVTEASLGGLRLLDVLAGYDRAILVDAIKTPGGNPGDVYTLAAEQFENCLHVSSSHDVDLGTALVAGRRLGIKLPREIRIVAVEVENVVDFGEEMTPAVAAAVPRAVEAVLRELDS